MKIGIKHIVLLITTTFLLSNACAQSISAELSKDSIYIGEPIQLKISTDKIANFSPFKFKEGDSIGKNFEILEVGKLDSSVNSVKQEFTITTFELGLQYFSPIRIFIDGKSYTTKPIPVFVSLVAVDTSKDFKDIKPIVYDPLTLKDRLSLAWSWVKSNWIISVVVLVAILFLIWFLFIRKQKKTEAPKPKKVIIPAHVLANKRLDELEGRQLWQNGNQKEYNVELTAIIQEYITNRFEVTTAERTSSEILHSLRFVEMGDKNKANLRELLMLSDLVKFAKELPTADENNKVLLNAKEFVETTKKSIS